VGYPVTVDVESRMEDRDRLTTFFRFFLAIPHLLLVGGPVFASASRTFDDGKTKYEYGTGGVLGAVAAVCAVIAWFAILFTGRYPRGLQDLMVFYMRWRVRAMAYLFLLRDEYPPFGTGSYAVSFELGVPRERDRLSVGLRLIYAIPQIIVSSLLGVAWALATVIAWFAILLTGDFPQSLYRFSIGALRWISRVEAYLLLLVDEYPPFSLE